MPEYEYYSNGKEYSSVDEAINDYINELNLGVSQVKLDRILKAIDLDIFENLAKGLTYQKTPVAPLSLRTVAQKGHDIPFLDTGLLLSSVKNKILNELHGIVFINDGHYINGQTVDERADLLNRGWTQPDGSLVPPRPFFYLSEKVLTEVDKILGGDE